MGLQSAPWHQPPPPAAQQPLAAVEAERHRRSDATSGAGTADTSGAAAWMPSWPGSSSSSASSSSPPPSATTKADRWLALELRRRKEQADVDVRHVQAALLSAAHEVDDCLKQLAVREAARDARTPLLGGARLRRGSGDALVGGRSAAAQQQETLQQLRESVRNARHGVIAPESASAASTTGGARRVASSNGRSTTSADSASSTSSSPLPSSLFAEAFAAAAGLGEPQEGAAAGDASSGPHGVDWLHGRLVEARTVALRCYDFLRDVTAARARAMLLVQLAEKHSKKTQQRGGGGGGPPHQQQQAAATGTGSRARSRV